MIYNFITNIQSCYVDVPSLLYYSHIPTALTALFFGILILIKGKENIIASRYLFLISLTFFIWTVLEGVLWLVYSSITMMFLWSFLPLLYVLLNLFCILFVYSMVEKKKLPHNLLLYSLALVFPSIIILITGLDLTMFDVPNCQAIENNYTVWYRYFFGASSIIFILVYLIYKYIKSVKEGRKKIILLGAGVISFLTLFSWSEITGSLTEDFSVTQYGFFGMPILIGFLSYSIVKFKTFNIKLLGAQALVWALVIFIGSQFLYMDKMPLSSIVITAVTLIMSAGIGLMIVRGIKREIAIREKIEKLADQLEHSNERLKDLDQQKSQFVSLASHQLRAPLTSIKGYLSMLLEGDYGEVKGEQREMIERVATSANNLVTIVGDFLDVSRIEQGKMVYDWSDFDLKPLVETVFNEQKPVAEKRGIVLNLDIEKAINFKVHADMNKLKQVFTNLVDNSIKYTPKGEVKISLSRPSPSIVRFEIKDTGIGINAQTLPKLFEKFTRAEGANEVNVIGTGLGLFVVKQMINAHEGGKVWAESEGLGKGSRFVVELKAI